MPYIRRFSSSLAVLVVCLLLASCGQRVSQANFDRLKPEMTIEQVKDLLGDPTESKSVGIGPLSGSLNSWKDGDKAITVTFVNGKATLITKSGF